MEYTCLNVEEIIHETDKAFLVTLEDFQGEFWIPKSLVSSEDMEANNYTKGDKYCSMSVQTWLAEQLGVTKD